MSNTHFRFPLNNAFRIFCIAVAIISVNLVGCSSRRHEGEPRAEDSLNVFKGKAKQLYDSYLGGSSSEATESLKESIRLAERANIPDHYRAGCLFFNYARLYVLEHRMAKPALAEEALVKARFWSLREAELGGNSAEEAGVFITSQTGERIEQFIDKWDRDHTQGSGPKYLHELSTGSH